MILKLKNPLKSASPPLARVSNHGGKRKGKGGVGMSMVGVVGGSLRQIRKKR